jgi:hypothetical protein
VRNAVARRCVRLLLRARSLDDFWLTVQLECRCPAGSLIGPRTDSRGTRRRLGTRRRCAGGDLGKATTADEPDAGATAACASAAELSRDGHGSRDGHPPGDGPSGIGAADPRVHSGTRASGAGRLDAAVRDEQGHEPTVCAACIDGGRRLIRHVRITVRGAFGRLPELLPQLPEGVRRSLPARRTIIPLLVAVAVIGYVVGHSRSARPERARIVRTAKLLIEYPPGWAPVARGPSIPGLALDEGRQLAPYGAAAGLVVGLLPADDPGPLPATFLERVRRQPQISIVDMAEAQAYRYARLSVRGLTSALTIFVIPNPEGRSTALACYAPVGGSAYMRACEGTVASATITGQPQSYQLTPEAPYATAVSAAIATLSRLRASLTRELRPHVSAATAEALARRLADGYAAARRSLQGVTPPRVAASAGAALVSAVGSAASGYRGLAAAAAEASQSAYAAARSRVAAAEHAVDRALENLVLLGYSPS